MIRLGQKQGCMVAVAVVAIALGLTATLALAQSFLVSERPSVEAKKPPQVQCTAFGWCKIGTVNNVVGHYTPVVSLSATQIRVYSNTANGSVDGKFYLRSCTWSSCGPATMVLQITAPQDDYIRTSGVARGASGTYYAVLYTGDGYPTQGGYSPSFATSPDGVSWTWHGPITLFGRNQSSAAALIVDESRTDDYACMAWLDIGPNLYLMHAPLPCMPADWRTDGANQWPTPGEQPQFVSVAKTPYGYHMIGATATAMKHVFSCTGLPPWTILEPHAPVQTSDKGTNLSWESSTNTIHALTSGVHFTLPARAFPC